MFVEKRSTQHYSKEFNSKCNNDIHISDTSTDILSTMNTQNNLDSNEFRNTSIANKIITI